jgi:hypothetical protein
VGEWGSERTAGGGDEAKALVELAAEETRAEFFAGGVGGEDFLNAFLLGLLRRDDAEARALALPTREHGEEVGAGLLLGREAILGDEVVGRVTPVVGEALGIPRRLGDRAPGAGAGVAESKSAAASSRSARPSRAATRARMGASAGGAPSAAGFSRARRLKLSSSADGSTSTRRVAGLR